MKHLCSEVFCPPTWQALHRFRVLLSAWVAESECMLSRLAWLGFGRMELDQSPPSQ